MENQTEKGEMGEILKETTKSLVEKMGIVSEIEIIDGQSDADSLICNIKAEESNYLIGQYGINLQALQHVVRLLIRKKTDKKINFILDVNSYRQEKNQSISALANSMAEQALLEKRAVVLRPMSPYERRLIHIELAENEQVKTESIGEGEDRRIVIKPADLI